MTSIDMIPDDVLDAFDLRENSSTTILKSGLIHASFKVSKNQENYFLQRINSKIFKNPQAVQENYSIVRNHLLSKSCFRPPAIILTIDFQQLYQRGVDSWRCFEFVDQSFSPEVIVSAEQAFEVASCFGKFAADLANLPASNLHVILPGFHNLGLRFQQFETALKNASDDWRSEARDLIEDVYQRKYLLEFYNSISRSPDYPLHTFHHDCKISNILFRQGSQQVISIIDLDTTQPGFFFSDVGDMLRSMVPSISEDDPDLEKLEFRIEFFNAVISGYEEATKHFLNSSEVNHLPQSGLIITYMQGMRFLTDFLNGNIYYQVTYPKQNKLRAANQFRLLSLMEQYVESRYNKLL